MLSNLPPGCSLSDIPGNRPEDEEWDAFVDRCYDAISLRGLDWTKLSQDDDDWLMSRIEHHADGRTPRTVAELVFDDWNERRHPR